MQVVGEDLWMWAYCPIQCNSEESQTKEKSKKAHPGGRFIIVGTLELTLCLLGKPLVRHRTGGPSGQNIAGI